MINCVNALRISFFLRFFFYPEIKVQLYMSQDNILIAAYGIFKNIYTQE